MRPWVSSTKIEAMPTLQHVAGTLSGCGRAGLRKGMEHPHWVAGPVFRSGQVHCLELAEPCFAMGSLPNRLHWGTGRRRFGRIPALDTREKSVLNQSVDSYVSTVRCGARCSSNCRAQTGNVRDFNASNCHGSGACHDLDGLLQGELGTLRRSSRCRYGS